MADAKDGSILDYWEHGPNGSIDQNKQYTEGRPSDHAVGVMYNAPWEAPFDGFAEHARRCARALATTGCPVHLRSTTPHLVPGDQEHEKWLFKAFGDLAHASIGRYAVQVHQVVPTEGLLYAMVRHRYYTDEELRAVNSLRVISTVWERSPIPMPDVDALNRIGQAWVACKQNAELLAMWGVTAPIRVVPIPFYPDDPHLKIRARTRPRAPGPPRFYHIGKWEPRKAQDKIIEAFLRAFQPGEAELHVKTSEFVPELPEYPGPSACVRKLVETDAAKAHGWTLDNVLGSVKIYQAKMPASQLVALHGLGDIYVTLSRGEGFDMPAFDAKLSRNRMIYTPSGGPQDFAYAHDYIVPARGTVPCPSFYRWGDGATYLDFDVADASVAMRAAAIDLEHDGTPDSNREPMDASRYERFTLAAVGKQMRSYLGELAPEVVR